MSSPSCIYDLVDATALYVDPNLDLITYAIQHCTVLFHIAQHAPTNMLGHLSVPKHAQKAI
jgi:hypothetical protein